MTIKYSRIQSLKIVREARRSNDICGVLKKYGLAQRDFERMQEQYGSTSASVKTVVKSMFLSDGSRNPVIVPNENVNSNLRIVHMSDKTTFKSNLAQHNFYMKNINKFQSLHLPCAPWDIPAEMSE